VGVVNGIHSAASEVAGAPIVVGTDGSVRAQVAVERASELGLALGVVVHVVSSYASTLGAAQGGRARGGLVEMSGAEELRGEAERIVESAHDRLVGRGLKVVTHISSDEPAHALVAVADHQQAQMIVVGNRGMTGPRRALGSVPNRVSHQAHCGVLIVPT
jgi:nucleotide-binding universal stress UspA family protein